MMKRLWMALMVLVAMTLAWWGWAGERGAPARPGPPSNVPTATKAALPAPPPAAGGTLAATPRRNTAQDVARPSSSPVATGGMALPRLRAEAVASLRYARVHGDPRRPPLAPAAATRTLPSDEELADPALYQRYEQRQNQRVYASFLAASEQKIRQLAPLVARAEREGMAPAQLAEGQRKLQGLKDRRKEMLERYPQLQPVQDTGPVSDLNQDSAER